MKCNNCQTAIPPSFTKALQDNSCPACGKTIMSTVLTSEFTSIKEKLADAEVDEATLVKVAAIIAGKYDLVPRGTGAATRAGMVTQRQKTRAQLQDGEIEVELLEEYPHLKTLPDDDRRREILALRAEAEREYGLSKGDIAAAKVANGSGAVSTELVSAMSSLMPPEASDVIELDGGSTDPFTAQRMAKLASIRGNASINRLRRSDG